MEVMQISSSIELETAVNKAQESLDLSQNKAFIDLMTELYDELDSIDLDECNPEVKQKIYNTIMAIGLTVPCGTPS